jgi:metal-responsive CopG/Arc/MetJ family transcriptional regulator
MNTKKQRRKKKVYFSMNEELCDKFEKYIEENLLNQSAVIEKLIEEFMKNKEIL